MKLIVCLLMFAAAGCNMRVVGPGKPPPDTVSSLVQTGVVDQNLDGVIDPGEIQQAIERPSGLLVFVCMCGVLLLIVMITMGYSKLITPRVIPGHQQVRDQTKQVINEQEQHK